MKIVLIKISSIAFVLLLCCFFSRGFESLRLNAKHMENTRIASESGKIFKIKIFDFKYLKNTFYYTPNISVDYKKYPEFPLSPEIFSRHIRSLSDYVIKYESEIKDFQNAVPIKLYFKEGADGYALPSLEPACEGDENFALIKTYLYYSGADTFEFFLFSIHAPEKIKIPPSIFSEIKDDVYLEISVKNGFYVFKEIYIGKITCKEFFENLKKMNPKGDS